MLPLQLVPARDRLGLCVNALIEASCVEVTSGEVAVIDTPSASGSGQKIARCPHCQVALWSVYAGAGAKFRFVRVGTLEKPAECPPDIHIFTSRKLPWVILPPDVPAVPEFYARSEYWPAESLARRERALAQG